MEKYRVGHDYQDYELDRFLVKDEVVEMEEERANEVNEKLQKLGTVLVPVKTDDESDAGIDVERLSVEELESLAEENNIEVEGTGKNGNVLRKDLEKALEDLSESQK